MPSRKTVGWSVAALLVALGIGTYLTKPWNLIGIGDSQESAATDKAPGEDKVAETPKGDAEKKAPAKAEAPKTKTLMVTLPDGFIPVDGCTYRMEVGGDPIGAKFYSFVGGTKCPMGIKVVDRKEVPLRHFKDAGGNLFAVDLNQVDWNGPAVQDLAVYAIAKN